MYELLRDFKGTFLVYFPDAAWQYRHDRIAELAEADGVTFDVVMSNIYAIATVIDNDGNKGYTDSFIESMLSKQHSADAIKYLDHRYHQVWDGILFHATPAKRKDPSGWMVRKNPHWELKWCERVGWSNPIAQTIVANYHEKALHENTAYDRARSRPKSVIDHETLDTMTPQILAHRIFVLDYQKRQYAPDVMTRLSGKRDNALDKFLSSMLYKQKVALAKELVWRWGYHPNPLERDAAAHYIDAKRAQLEIQFGGHLIDAASDLIATDVIASEVYGNATHITEFWDETNPQDLPIPSQLRDAERMTDVQIVRKFFALLDETDPEANRMTSADKQMILTRLRGLLKNTKSDF